MRWPVLNCPFCGGVLPNTEVKAGRPLTCPGCSRQLQMATGQLYLSGLIGLCLDTALCLLIGLRGLTLLVAIVLLWFPVYVAWDFIFVRLVKPRFEAYVPRNSGTSLFGR